MRPYTLKALLEALVTDRAMTVTEVRKKGKFNDQERVREWLEDLVYVGLAERECIHIETKGRPVTNGYRLVFGRIS